MEIQLQLIGKSRIDEVDFNNLAFGRSFADHMLVAEYANGAWQSMTIQPFQNLILNFLNDALVEGGWSNTELYFEQLTPLAILSEQAEDTNKSIEQVEDETNKAMENPDSVDKETGNVEQMGEEGWVYTSQPNFTKNYEVYK
jgi:hypothetical protein